MLSKLAVSAILLLILVDTLSEACETDEMRLGCRIHKADCSCGYGCKLEFRYDNREECRLALKKGKREDICNVSTPCEHGGSCTQITAEPGFKCRCEGTEYFGPNCETPCPRPDSARFRGGFPHECVVI